jgi:predicted nuclease of predicted toxin-antitoxin system
MVNKPVRLLLDQGLPRSAVALLRQQGWTVEHVGELGMGRASDQEILAHARTTDAMVITLDSDFHTLLAISQASAPSVTRIRIEGLNAQRFVELFARAWPLIEQEASRGSAITITPTQIRFRGLPFR